MQHEKQARGNDLLEGHSSGGGGAGKSSNDHLLINSAGIGGIAQRAGRTAGGAMWSRMLNM